MLDFVLEHKNFLTRLLCLILILISLLVYQNHAKTWAAEVEENEEKIAKVEAYNAEVLRKSGELTDYEDGTYEGSGIGFGGDIQVEVTIEDGQIEDIEILNAADEDEDYFVEAIAIIDDIKKANNTKVDTVSGATFSSMGILDAVKDALEQAVDE